MRAQCKEILFRNEENGYTVASFLLLREQKERKSMPEEIFTAVGEFVYISEGDIFLLNGQWKIHPNYGRQFSVSESSQELPVDEDAIYHYLCSPSITGIGPKMASRIVARFGKDTLSILQNSWEKLAEIKGISKTKAQSISSQVAQKSDTRELFFLLQSLNLGTAKILSIYHKYGAESVSVVKNDPYRLADEIKGISFLSADSIALSLGCERDSLMRKKCALVHVLRQFTAQGHTYVPLDQLMEKCWILLDSMMLEDEEEQAGAGTTALSEKRDVKTLLNKFSEGMIPLIEQGEICCFSLDAEQRIQIIQADMLVSEANAGQIRIAFFSLLDKEIRSARMLVQKCEDSDEKKFGDLPYQVKKTTDSLRISLAGEQTEAVFTAAENMMSIITGGPGTGKTMVICVLANLFSSMGEKVVLCAPTGRAAKRMTESSGFPAKTIHRLLEVQRSLEDGEGTVFLRDEDNPIEGDVIIVDEVSMLDTSLLFSFLRAIRPASRLIFVGDQNQLPSVGAGNVLSDMLSSEVIPSVCLTEIFRQAQKSRIVMNAHRVLHGENMIFDQSLESDCMLIHKESAQEISDAVWKLCAKVLPDTYGMDVPKDCAVLSPSRKGAGGVTELNNRLQELFNTDKEKIWRVKDQIYFTGGKVMQVKNNYDISCKNEDGSVGTGVFNGEIGFVSRVSPPSITVKMEDGREVDYGQEDLDNLEMAYALTVHKSQGSEYPVVILAIPPGPPMLHHRNLLYTALTRAKKRVFVVSSGRILRRMIENRMSQKRMTSLLPFLMIYAQKRTDLQ